MRMLGCYERLSITTLFIKYQRSILRKNNKINGNFEGTGTTFLSHQINKAIFLPPKLIKKWLDQKIMITSQEKLISYIHLIYAI